MPSITYWDSTIGGGDRRQELGTTNFDNEFVPMYADASGHLNADFVETLNDERMTSFSVRLESGSATLRKENFRIVDGKTTFYWYAYKKLKGKLNKTYVGLTDNLTEEILEAAIETVNKPKEVTQSFCVTKETKPIAPIVSVELAGNGKDEKLIQPSIPDVIPDDWNAEAEQWKRIAANHQKSCNMAWDEVSKLKAEIKTLTPGKIDQLDLLVEGKQPSLMELANDPVKLLTHKNKELERQNKDLNKRLIESQERVDKRNQLLDTLEAQNKELNEIVGNNSKLTERLETRVSALQKTLDERDSELFRTQKKLLQHDDAIAPAASVELAECKQLLIIRGEELNESISMRNEVLEINNHLQMQIESLQDELRKTETQAYELNERGLGLKELHKECLDRLFQTEQQLSKLQTDYKTGEQEAFDNLDRFYAIAPVLKKYAQLAKGKDKRNHPRFAYLIDFLAEIDNLS